MSNLTRSMMMGAAGAASGEGLYADDVFSTYLYEGNGSTQTITNGIDLAGEGGLVWIKGRNDIFDHYLVDTERGVTKYLKTHTTAAEGTSSPTSNVTSFNSDGFSLAGSSNDTNNPNSKTYASWTFRKAPGFFDVVTYNGPSSNNTPQDIPHNLGVVPAVIISKSTSDAYPWYVYHKDLGADKFLQLESADAAATNVSVWDNTTPTDTTFRVGNNNGVNTNNGTHVAYLFADGDQSFGTNGNESIIKCGSFTTGAGGVTEVDLGWEPQWLLVKPTTTTGAWRLVDNMRGFVTYGPTGTQQLFPNTTGAESSGSNWGPTSTGFKISYGGSSGIGLIYVAIRRPHKPPTAGTDVYATDTSDATSPSPPQYNAGFPPDAVFRKDVDTASGTLVSSRLQGTSFMYANLTNAEDSGSLLTWDNMYGWSTSSGVDTSLRAWMFRRAPGFMDVVAYTATGGNTNNNVSHNLGAVPEMIIVKKRDGISGWPVYHTATGLSTSTALHSDGVDPVASLYWSSTPTATQFYPYGSDTNANNGDPWIAYLFATLPGISKVGSYTGTGSNIDVDCGFTAGARFVLIKRYDVGSTGDWYVWDTARGIVSGDDPYFLLNVEAAQVTNTDYIDPLNAGFTVTSSAPAALNASGGTYLFLAIA